MTLFRTAWTVFGPVKSTVFPVAMLKLSQLITVLGAVSPTVIVLPDVLTFPAEGFCGKLCAAAPPESANVAAAVERRSWNRILDEEIMVTLSYSRMLTSQVRTRSSGTAGIGR